MQQEKLDPNEFGPLLLDIGTKLLQTGASTNRIRLTIMRFAGSSPFLPHVAIGPRSVSLTLNDATGKAVFNAARSIQAQGVNFKMISGISRLSWTYVEQHLTLQQIRAEIDRLAGLPHYPRLIVLALVSLAGAAFCFTFGGSAIEMCVVFGATFVGLFLKQELLKRATNAYICTFLSAFAAAVFTSAFYKAGVELMLEPALSTCVLFLIPGVPLINGFTDLMDGFILNGMERGINVLMHVLAIAFGLTLTIYLFNLYL